MCIVYVKKMSPLLDVSITIPLPLCDLTQNLKILLSFRRHNYFWNLHLWSIRRLLTLIVWGVKVQFYLLQISNSQSSQYDWKSIYGIFAINQSSIFVQACFWNFLFHYSIFLSLLSYNALLITLYIWDKCSYIAIMCMMRLTILVFLWHFFFIIFPLKFYVHFSVISWTLCVCTYTHTAVGLLIDIAKNLQINLKRTVMFYIWIPK